MLSCLSQALQKATIVKFIHLKHFFRLIQFFLELAHHIREKTGQPLSFHYLLQRIAVVMQRGNAAAVLGTALPPQQF